MNSYQQQLRAMLSFDEEDDTSTGFNAVTSNDGDMDRKIHEVFRVEYLSSISNNTYTPTDDNALEYDIVDENEIRLCDVLKNLGIQYHCCRAIIDCDKLVQYGWDRKYVFVFGPEEWVFQGVDEWITGMSSWVFTGKPENVLKSIPAIRSKCSTRTYNSPNMMGIIRFDCRGRDSITFDCHEIMATADVINQEINSEGTTCITKIIDDFKVYVDTDNFTADIENPLTFDGNKVRFINDGSCDVTVNLKYDRSSGGYAHGLGSFGIFFGSGIMNDNRLSVNIDATTDNQFDHIYILAISRACLYSLTSNIPINYISNKMELKGASFCRAINPRTISKQINQGETKPKEVTVNIPVK